MFWRKNPIEKSSLRELQEEEIRLRSRLDRLKKDIDLIEKKKKKLFQEGIGADKLKKKMLAQEYKSLDLEQKLKLKDFISTQEQYTLTKNLVIVKKYEKELKKEGIWEKLRKAKPEQLEKTLARISIEGKNFDETVKNLNKVFEMNIADFEESEDEAEKDLLEAWSKVEAEEVDVNEVLEEMSIGKKLEEEKL